MSFADRIALRKQELAKQDEQQARAQRDEQQAEAAKQQRYADEALAIAALVHKFKWWAKQNGIRPKWLYRREGRRRVRAWELVEVVTDKSISDNRTYYKTLRIYKNGEVTWFTSEWYNQAVSPADLEDGIITFIARSNYRVPWPE